jgi:anti-anti-sigma factor
VVFGLKGEHMEKISEYITLDLKDNYTLVVMHTDLDSSTVPLISTVFDDVITHADRNVRLDLHQSTNIDASGIGIISFLYKRLKQLDFELELTGLKDQPLALVESLQINKIIQSNQH